MICAPTARRYSLSNGSDFFPTMSLQELDKIDATQHHFGSRTCYTPLDAKLFDDDRTVDRVVMLKSNVVDKHSMIDERCWYVNSKGTKSSYNLCEDRQMLKAPRRDSLCSMTSSRRNSLCSLSDSYCDEEASLLPAEYSIREGAWNDHIASINNLSRPQEVNENRVYAYQHYTPRYEHDTRIAPYDNRQLHDEYAMVEAPHAQSSIDYDPDYFTHTMESLATSMAETFKSQQSIHDWDKKMGLKRSHSKTMRMSMRTRKKLRALIKKELGY
jgi:hypothetical protein